MAEDEYQERVYTIPLRSRTQQVPQTKRAPRALEAVKEFVARHLKADEADVWIDDPVNDRIWSNGREQPPAKLRVRAIRFEDGVVEVSLPEE
ncbi:50S ribosomal protein L31e [Thermoplasmatales archaeon SW_10_69_26]|nr:MAG: 50S ribosomal protein L31e [Thermoplasmatales archaeon SW_10_69_26]